MDAYRVAAGVLQQAYSRVSVVLSDVSDAACLPDYQSLLLLLLLQLLLPQVELTAAVVEAGYCHHQQLECHPAGVLYTSTRQSKLC